jgi:hypothetical protein
MSSKELVAIVVGLSAVLLSGCGGGAVKLSAGETGALIFALGNGTATQPTGVVSVRGRNGEGPEGPPTATLPANAGPIQTINIAPYDPTVGPPGHTHGGPVHPGAHCHFYVELVTGWAMYHC